MKKNSLFKTFVAFTFPFLISSYGFAQKPLASPRDSVSRIVGAAKISINYGSPSVKGRKIWGDLVPYGKVWRAGANEATRFTCSNGIKVEGQELTAGEYAFFVIPGETEWIVIFNKTPRQWGAFDYKKKDDALRVTVKPKPIAGGSTERLVYTINPGGISLLWENLEVPVSIK